MVYFFLLDMDLGSDGSKNCQSGSSSETIAHPWLLYIYTINRDFKIMLNRGLIQDKPKKLLL